MPTQISLLDIFNTESSLSDKILGDNDSYVTVRINNTCSMFNKMTKGEIHKPDFSKALSLFSIFR